MKRNTVIPADLVFYHNSLPHELDLEAICVFGATGFFLDQDTFWKDLSVVPPATEYEMKKGGDVEVGSPWFNWHYSPRDIGFEEVLDEFADLFEKITLEYCNNKRVILPLSGGLDSRSQAVALKAIGHPNVASYSYKFAHSFDETSYGKKIAKQCGFSFKELEIPRGYLWNRIDELAQINKCYSDFTHPRQMAVIDEISELGNLFYLGHWGDVLFDDMNIPDVASETEQLEYLKKKILKKGGLELASDLWRAWKLEGDFIEYLDARLLKLLRNINIENANARIRAFKSLYWAPRWTSVNLSIFSSMHPIVLPYYDNRMCEFICTVPEKYLAGRKIQIEYIKRKSPEVAAIKWQDFSPCNLYSYKSFFHPKYWPYRAARKTRMLLKQKIKGPSLVLRNWENQFLGKDNAAELEKHLFNKPSFNDLVPPHITKRFYKNFQEKNQVYYAHPLSMLLTLSLFSEGKH